MTKRLWLSIDFSIEIADKPPLLPEGTIEPPDPEYDGMQARLLEAVKNHPEVLTRWLQNLMVSKVGQHGSAYWYDALMDGEPTYQDIFGPAIATLAKEDQEFFDEAVQLNIFEECIDLFLQSFTVEESPPDLVEQRLKN